MATVTIAEENKTVHTEPEITALLAQHGIDYERWTSTHPVADNAPPEEILAAYASEIDVLKAKRWLRDGRPDRRRSAPRASRRCWRSSTVNTGMTKTRCDSSSQAMECSTYTPTPSGPGDRSRSG